ncbi:MAG: DUF262 domain-containing protein [Nocardioidaceae bacterium]
MAATTPLDSTREALKSLLEEAHDGRIQIPEFQRKLILEDEWIKSLLASVSLSYPIGAVTLLKTGNPDVRFRARPIARGPSPSSEPQRLLVDGQRRITSLYQVLASGQVVQTHGDHNEPSHRWYYVDINAALNPDADRDDAIISVPETRQVRTLHEVMLDLSTVELEWEACLFPLRLVFGAHAELRRWRRGFAKHGAIEDAEARGELMNRFEADVLETFDGYLVPTIILGKETARWSVRVHGGREGRSLSDQFRVTARDLHRR